MKSTLPARRHGRLVALVTAVTLLAAPLAVVPAALSAPSASAATATSVTIKKIGTKTAPYAKKATVKPIVVAQGKVSVKSKTLTVKKSGKTIAKNKKSVRLKAGTYKVTTRVTYRTYRLTSAHTKVWSATKATTRTQTLVVKQGKKPSQTSPVSKYDCPSWAPIKGNQSGIYHVPGGRYYKQTTPEKCFTTESAARKAGYRASKNG
ncbi:hypothetical protein ACFQ80_13220 [Isoptericola sp. NPDC056578]|uniref:sunset domain-containing protein n=1 Tax=Isoptericola sp. NPDC056578 TaxID=3345870 RepID=UPI0036CDF9F1